MELNNTFTVPVPIEEAWLALLDIERVATCVPGASLESLEGDEFTGSVRVKLGPVQMTYKGKATFVERDESAFRAVIAASGKESKGAGTAQARITTILGAQGAETEVRVTTDLAVTGKPAQFGRGVMEDVSARILGQFAECLSAQLTSGSELPDEPGAIESNGSKPAVAPSAPEPIDLLAVAGLPDARRIAIAGGLLAVLVVLIAAVRRSR